jgi:hypothetical protein
MGLAFGSPGNNFFEVLEPIDQTIHDFRLRGAFERERYQLQFGYTFSLFENAARRLIADNPCFGLAACGSDAVGAPARGQVSLPPDNMAHTVLGLMAIKTKVYRPELDLLDGSRKPE